MSLFRKTLALAAVVALVLPVAPSAEAYRYACLKNQGAYTAQFYMQRLTREHPLREQWKLWHQDTMSEVLAYIGVLAGETKCIDVISGSNKNKTSQLRPGDTFRLVVKAVHGKESICGPFDRNRERTEFPAADTHNHVWQGNNNGEHMSFLNLENHLQWDGLGGGDYDNLNAVVFQSGGTTLHPNCKAIHAYPWEGCFSEDGPDGGIHALTKPGCVQWGPARNEGVLAQVHRPAAFLGAVLAYNHRHMNLNQRNETGATALHFAAQYNQAIRIAHLLRFAETDANATEHRGFTPLMLAILHRSPDAVKELLHSHHAGRVDPNIPGTDGRLPLHSAIRWGDHEVIRALIGAGADAARREQTDGGKTPRELVADLNRDDLADVLGSAGINTPDENGETHLHRQSASLDAVGNQYDVDRYIALVNRPDINLNAQDNLGRTPLHRAVTDGAFTQVRALLAAGADPNIPANDGTYPVHHVTFATCCTYEYHERYMNALFEAGARAEHDPRPRHLHLFDYNRMTEHHRELMVKNGLMELEWQLRDNETGNRLHLELANNDHHGIRRLMDYDPALGVDVNATDSAGRTALHLASRLSDEWIPTRMLERGADLNAADNDGMRPVHHAAAGWAGIFNLLVARGADPFAKDNNGRSAVHHAAGSPNPESRQIVEILAEAAAAKGDAGDFEMNRPDNNNTTPAQLAAAAGKPHMQARLQEIASPDRVDETELPRLHSAVSAGDLERVAFLIANGANLELPADIGGNQVRPLHLAAGNSAAAPEIAQALLDAGADINARDSSFGRAPLHSATIVENLPVVRLLLESGADTALRTDAGDQALDIARAADNAELIALLQPATFNPDEVINGKPRLHHAVIAGDIDEVRRLLDLGANIESRDDENGGERTALFYTSPFTNRTHDTEHPDIARLLLERGADPNAVEGIWRKETPLIRAAGLGHVEVVRVLLDGGADVNAQNSDGHTAYQLTGFPSYIQSAAFDARRQQVREILSPLMEN